jgi:XTP/dITP diphosphohydrolase
MSTCLFVATTSQGKLRDFRAAAEAHALAIEPLPNLKEIPAPEEDGATFAANAVLKAIYYSRFAPGALVMADDSGLEVDALDGEPGVRSARFAADATTNETEPGDGTGGNTTDERNNALLLDRLTGIPAARRTARYRCVLAVVRDGELLQTADGSVEGVILDAPRGSGGFGYDPLFYLSQLQKTMAELDLETKHGLSHRGRAIAALLPRLGL